MNQDKEKEIFHRELIPPKTLGRKEIRFGLLAVHANGKRFFLFSFFVFFVAFVEVFLGTF